MEYIGFMFLVVFGCFLAFQGLVALYVHAILSGTAATVVTAICLLCSAAGVGMLWWAWDHAPFEITAKAKP